MGQNLTGQLISATYEDLVQISGSSRNILTDGTGSNITSLVVTASFATTAISASFATTANTSISASYAQTSTSASHALIADVALNVPATASYALYAEVAGFASSSLSASYALTASFAVSSSADSITLQKVTDNGAITTNSIILSGSSPTTRADLTFTNGILLLHQDAVASNYTRGINISVSGSTVNTIEGFAYEPPIAIGVNNNSGGNTMFMIGSNNSASFLANGTPSYFFGESNTLTGNQTKYNVLIGRENTVTGDAQYGALVGGTSNLLRTSDHSGIFAGFNNEVASGHSRSVVIGGQNLTSRKSDEVTVPNLTVSGSADISGSLRVSGSIITGNGTNTVGTNNTEAAIGGKNNSVTGNLAVAIGGESHTVTGFRGGAFGGEQSTVGGTNATVIGGYNNQAASSYDVVIGGTANLSNAASSVVVGGTNNQTNHARSVTLGGNTLATTRVDEVVVPNLTISGSLKDSNGNIGTAGQVLSSNGVDKVLWATGSGGGTTPTGSLMVTGSVSSNTLTFTKGDGSTFALTVDTGSAVSVSTGSLMVTGSVSSNTLTFTKGDGSTFDLTVNTGSAVSVNTGSLLVTASISNATTTYTKGDGSTFALTTNNVQNASTASIATSASFATNALTASYALTTDLGTSATASFTGSTWTFDHNLNQQYVLIAAYDSNDNAIIPQTVNLTSANQAVISFPTSVQGVAVASLGNGVTSGGGATAAQLWGSVQADNFNKWAYTQDYTYTPTNEQIITVHVSSSGVHLVDLTSVTTSASVNVLFYPESLPTYSVSTVAWKLPSNGSVATRGVFRTQVTASSATGYLLGQATPFTATSVNIQTVATNVVMRRIGTSTVQPTAMIKGANNTEITLGYPQLYSGTIMYSYSGSNGTAIV